jgi:hypothetical protein
MIDEIEVPGMLGPAPKKIFVAPSLAFLDESERDQIELLLSLIPKVRGPFRKQL